MQTVSLSKVGGLTTEVLARMGNQRLAVLTSDKIVRAVVLPHTNNKQLACQAASQYIALANGHNADVIKAGRLKGKLLTMLANAGVLTVERRGVPVVILLPPPTDAIQAERGAKTYLEELGIIT